MSKTIEDMIKRVIDREGRIYTHRSDDAGGPTKSGITQRTLSGWLRRPATIDDVKNLSEEVIFEIYFRRYVEEPGFGDVIALSETIAEELIDSGINVGPTRASEWLQRLLNALNREGRDYSDIAVDGDVGPATLGALRAYLKKRGGEGEKVMCRALDSLQTAFYVGLAERRSFDEQNLYGWLRVRTG